MSVDLGTHPGLLDDLRSGERVAFVRFYELFRLPVYNLVLRLVRSEGDAVAVTQEVFIRAYRYLLGGDGAVAVRPLIYKVAVDTCAELDGGPPADCGAGESGGERALECRGWEDSPLAQRLEQTLQALDLHQRAALLLNDVVGLPREEMAAVFGLSAEATAALVFRAGERFRLAFEERASGRTEGICRLAETAVASAAGRRTLAPDETRKLREHTEYCEQCRRAAPTWTVPAIGLGLFARDVPLPDSLHVVPVFGATSLPADDTGEAAGPVSAAGWRSGTVVATLAGVGRALTSKAAAYALAAACSAALLGLTLYVSQHEWQLKRQPVSSPTRSLAATRRQGPAPVVRTPRKKVAGRSSQRASSPVGEMHTLTHFAVADIPDARVSRALASVPLSPSTSPRQAGQWRLGEVALPAGGAVADTGAVQVPSKANRDKARAAGAASPHHGKPASSYHRGNRRGRTSKASEHAWGPRQGLHPHSRTGGRRAH